ncbi:MAG TPA: AAA family ATPase [Tenacibaculum sp.]|nr:AAA family ATPase [Tenacibaculum sp.]HBI40262.1 AAA family ATPase [Tenacibaculum sp.]
MINKRLLIKSLLSKNDENSFYDKKQKLSLQSREGKAKFVKHVCALSNSNPDNNSYIVIGVQDEENKIIGVDFFDDSKIQNLVNAYLVNPPKISYENVHFPRLPRYKVIGLVTIFPNKEVTSLSKTAWKYPKKTIFYRVGSNSLPVEDELILTNTNKPIVEAIEKHARNNIELTLNGVFDFYNRHKKEYNPQYKVFSEQFVLCWAGKKSLVNGEEYFSRVDIELINEQVRLFYSDLDEVKISFNENCFIITEYILLGIDKEYKHYPLEKTIINFKENGRHDIATEFLFKSPKFDRKALYHIYNSNNSLVSKIEKKIPLSAMEHEDLLKIPTSYLICYLNGFSEAAEQLKKVKTYIRSLERKKTYIEYKEVLRVIRKVKYN